VAYFFQNKSTDLRRVATRYDKLAEAFLEFVCLAIPLAIRPIDDLRTRLD
jgi:hypothetical protein